jgi:hypothetical protein
MLTRFSTRRWVGSGRFFSKVTGRHTCKRKCDAVPKHTDRAFHDVKIRRGKINIASTSTRQLSGFRSVESLEVKNNEETSIDRIRGWGIGLRGSAAI